LGEQLATVAQELGVGTVLGLAQHVGSLWSSSRLGEIFTWNHTVATFVKAAPDLHHYCDTTRSLTSVKKPASVAGKVRYLTH
jgi:hypothetical protein